MIFGLLSALLGFAQDAPKLDVSALLRGDLSGVERTWGAGAETLWVPGEFAMTLADVRALTPSKAMALPGASRVSLVFGDAQSSKGGVTASFADGKMQELTFQFLGSDVGWKSVLARLEAPEGKLWCPDGDPKAEWTPVRSSGGRGVPSLGLADSGLGRRRVPGATRTAPRGVTRP